jgi:hypothetical protein
MAPVGAELSGVKVVHGSDGTYADAAIETKEDVNAKLENFIIVCWLMCFYRKRGNKYSIIHSKLRDEETLYASTCCHSTPTCIWEKARNFPKELN